MELTAPGILLQDISRRLGQPLTLLYLRIFPAHDSVTHGRLKIGLGIVSLYLEVMKTTGTNHWRLNREKCTQWNNILKYNTAMVFDGVVHRPISKETKGMFHLTNITEGFVECDALTMDSWVNTICQALEQTRPAADWTNNANRNTFQGGQR